MELYTKEQIIQAYELGLGLTHEEVMEQFVPIQLPSDEEIKEEAKKEILYALEAKGFHDGANWMRDKIKGGGNE